MKSKIYPSVTTWKVNWKNQLKEVKTLGLQEISLFLTGIDKKERMIFYKFLDRINIKKIIHVHIRHDFSEDEIIWLSDKYNIEFFTIHPVFLKKYRRREIAKKIYLENCGFKKFKRTELIKEIGGICLDLSHYELARMIDKKEFEATKLLLEKHPVGYNHLSGLKKKPEMNDDLHLVNNFKANFEFLNRIPETLFAPQVFIELQNTIRKQLEIRDYLYRNFFK